MKWVDSHIDHKGRSITEIKDINEKEFQWADGTLETLFIDENPYVLNPAITRQQWMELPEAVQEEYQLDTGQKGLLIYKLKSDLPTKTTIKRSHERITRKSNVAKGTMSVGRTGKPTIENKAIATDAKGKALWHLPSYTVYLSKPDRNKVEKCNKYLQHMQKRIRKAVSKREYKYAARLGLILIQRSKVFTVYVLTRTCKGYFWELKEMDVWSNMNKYSEFVRKMGYRIMIKRFYIPKKGGKFRPIGAPNLWTKMVFKSLEIVMRELLEGRIGAYQHGFMREKGCQTASREVIRRLRENPKAKVYEFDLKSFFNKINPIRVCDAIERDFGPIGDWVRAITLGSIPRIPIKDLKPEEELVYDYDYSEGKRGKKMLHKYGFTQGSPLSPLLSAYGLELAGIGKIKGLIMYADDGVIITEEVIKMNQRLSSYLMKLSGIRLAIEKPQGETRKFKFLGLEYDLDDRSITLEEDRINPTNTKDGWIRKSKSERRPLPSERILTHRIDIDDSTPEEINDIISYTGYGERTDRPTGPEGKEGETTQVEPKKLKGDTRVFAKESMVGRTSWLSYHISRVQEHYQNFEWSSVIGGLRNWTRSLNSEPKGEGWNDAWTSTVMAVELVKQFTMRGNRRDSSTYTLPCFVRPFSNVVTTTHAQSFRNFRYDVVDREEQEAYYKQKKLDENKGTREGYAPGTWPLEQTMASFEPIIRIGKASNGPSLFHRMLHDRLAQKPMNDPMNPFYKPAESTTGERRSRKIDMMWPDLFWIDESKEKRQEELNKAEAGRVKYIVDRYQD